MIRAKKYNNFFEKESDRHKTEYKKHKMSASKALYTDSHNDSFSVFYGTQSGFSIMRKNSKLSIYGATEK